MTCRRTKLIILLLLALLLGWAAFDFQRPAPVASNPKKVVESPAKPSPHGSRRNLAALKPPASARILDERRLPINAAGVFSRLRLVETKSHLLVREVEEWQQGTAGVQDRMSGKTEMVADRLIVKMRDGQTLQGLTTWAKSQRLEVLRQLPNTPFVLLQLPDADVSRFDQWLGRLNQAGLPIEYAEPDFIRHAASVPDDLRFAEQWALRNTGQTGGKPGADVSATTSWDITTGSTSVVVAVLDTGIDLTHPDLLPNLWVNSGEVAGNQKDDDGDGYVDDVNGWNFVAGNNNVADDNDHGSHCAGIIGAVGNNYLGVSGICPVVRIMPVKIIDSEGYVTSANVVAGMNYAVARGASITSNSYGGPGSSQAEKTAFNAALNAGVLVVTAAGNDYPGVNVDVHPSYPGSYTYSNIINVAATGHNDILATFSDYGPVGVDLAAPGVGILSTIRGGYGYDEGTSMACPLVAGACALLKAAQPGLSWSALKLALLNGVDPLPSLAGKVKSGGRLNVARALRIGAGPCIELMKTVVADGKALGARGNADGIINPGEDITVAVTLKNTGPAIATAVTTTATITTGSDVVTVTRGSRAWGNIAAAAAPSNATAPFVLHIAASAASQPFTLHLAHQDNAGHTWSSDSNFAIAGTQALTGLVTFIGTGKPASKATVSYAGPVSGHVLTGVTGGYALKIPDGTYSVSASLTGYETSATQTITVPSTPGTANFQMGRGQLTLSPASISKTIPEGGSDHQALTLKNTGTLPLTFAASSSHLGTTIATGHTGDATWDDLQPTPGGLTITTGIPYQHGFETTALTGWVAARYYGFWFGHYALDTINPASGARCLHQWGLGEPAGLAHSFPEGTQPGYVSVWVKAGTTTGRLAGVAMEAWTLDENDYPYYVPIATVIAAEGGFFQASDATRRLTKASYKAGEWHHVEMIFDWQQHAYDVRVDGVLADAAVPMGYPYQVSRIRLYNETEGEAWWDDVTVAGTDADWLHLQAPATTTLAPGESTILDVAFDAKAMRPGVATAQVNIRSSDPVHPLTNVPVTLTVQSLPLQTVTADSTTVTVEEDVLTPIQIMVHSATTVPLVAIIKSLPAKGTLYQTWDGVTPGAAITTVPTYLPNVSGQMFYLAPRDQFGQGFDTVSFQVQDARSSKAKNSTGTITINVSPVNDAPVANDDIFAELADGTYGTLAVLANDTDVDNDVLHVASITQGAHGQVIINPDGATLSYLPAANFTVGQDSFTYTADDGHGGTCQANVTIVRGNTTQEAWPSVGHDGGRSNFSPVSTGGAMLQKSWETTIVDDTWASPLVADGRVVINVANASTYKGQLVTFDLYTGLEAWRAPASGATMMGQPLLHQGKVIAAMVDDSGQAAVRALDLQTGSVVWSLPFTASGLYPSYQPPAANEDGIHIVVSGTSGFRALVLNPVDGTIIRERHVQGNYDEPLDVLLAEGLEIFRADSSVVAYQPGELTQPSWASSNMKVYVGSAGGFFGLNNTTLQSIGPGAAGPVSGLNGAKVNWSVNISPDAYSPPICAASGAVYAADATSILAFSPVNGKLLGTFRPPAQESVFSIAAGADTLFAATYYHVWLYDLRTGQLRQTLPTSGTMAVAAGSLVTLTTSVTPRVLRRFSPVRSGLAATVALAQTVTLNEDENAVINLTGTGSAGTVIRHLITRLPAVGTLYQTPDGVTPGTAITSVPTNVNNAQGKVVYVPIKNESGDPYANFGFKVADELSLSDEGTINLRVMPVPDAPLAVPDTVYTQPGVPVASIWPAMNDVDVDGGALYVTSFAPAAAGKAMRNADGSIRYVPAPGAKAGDADTFTYTVTNTEGLSSTGTVEIQITDPFLQAWTQAGGNPQHTGRYQGALGSQLVQKWVQNASSETNSYGGSAAAPVAANGRLYDFRSSYFFGSFNAVALDWDTGATVWQSALTNTTTLYGGSIWDGRLIMLAQLNYSPWYLQAWDATTGGSLWSMPTGSADYSTIPTVSDAGVLAPTSSNHYGRTSVFDPVSGTEVPLGSTLIASGVTLDGATAIVESSNSYDSVTLESWNTTTRTLNWSSTLPLGFGSLPSVACVDGGRVFTISGSPEMLTCVDETTGSTLWQAALGVYNTPQTIVVGDGIVYVGGSNTQVKAFSTVNGQTMGLFLGSPVPAVCTPLAVTDDVLITSGDGTNTLLFDRQSHSVVQTLPTAGCTIVAGGKIFIRSLSQVVCYGPAGPSPQGTPTPAPTIMDTSGAVTSVPTSAPSTFHISSCERTADGRCLHVSWPGTASGAYVVECSTDLKTWVAVSSTLTGTEGEMSFDVPATGMASCFIRVRASAAK